MLIGLTYAEAEIQSTAPYRIVKKTISQECATAMLKNQEAKP